MSADVESQRLSRVSDAGKGDTGSIPLPMVVVSAAVSLVFVWGVVCGGGGDRDRDRDRDGAQNPDDNTKPTEGSVENGGENEVDEKTDEDPQSSFQRAGVQIAGGLALSAACFGLGGYWGYWEIPECFFCGSSLSEDLTPVSESAWGEMTKQTAALKKLWDLPKDAFSDADRAAALSSVGPDDWPKTLHKAALLAALKTHKMPTENAADAELLKVFVDAKSIFDIFQLVIQVPESAVLAAKFEESGPFHCQPFTMWDVRVKCESLMRPLAGKTMNKFEFLAKARYHGLYADLPATSTTPATSKEDLVEQVWNRLFAELRMS
eukprot:gene148-151_t